MVVNYKVFDKFPSDGDSKNPNCICILNRSSKYNICICTHVAYLNLKSLVTSKCLTYSNSAIEE